MLRAENENENEETVEIQGCKVEYDPGSLVQRDIPRNKFTEERVPSSCRKGIYLVDSQLYVHDQEQSEKTRVAE